MPVGFMTEATPAGRDGRSAVQVGNRSRSGPEVTAPGGAEMVLHDHMGKPPTPRAGQGRAAGQRAHVSGDVDDGPVPGGGVGFPGLRLWRPVAESVIVGRLLGRESGECPRPGAAAWPFGLCPVLAHVPRHQASLLTSGPEDCGGLSCPVTVSERGLSDASPRPSTGWPQRVTAA